MSEPTDEQIRRELAEFAGWVDIKLDETVYGHSLWLGHMKRSDTVWGYVPDYLNDLNAMHKIERELGAKTFDVDYTRILFSICERREIYESVFAYFPAWYEVAHLVMATARQRALAAYQTITEHREKEPTE